MAKNLKNCYRPPCLFALENYYDNEVQVNCSYNFRVAGKSGASPKPVKDITISPCTHMVVSTIKCDFIFNPEWIWIMAQACECYYFSSSKLYIADTIFRYKFIM